MQFQRCSGRAIARLTLGAALALAAFMTVGCIRPHSYLDPSVREVPASEFKKADPPKSVHLAFEFQLKGAPNAGATTQLASQVKEELQKSGLFANLEAPSGPDVASLSVIINNVPITGEGDAMKKGFATGFTFGLVGSTVTDGYVCTVSYLAPGAKSAIVKTSRHAIHTTIGNANPPQGAIPAESLKVAVTTMVRQVLAVALRDLSVDPQF